MLVACAALALAECTGDTAREPRAAGGARDVADASADSAAAHDVVARFGARLQTVSLLAPDSVAAARLREAYGDLVTPALLAEWTADPASAPGRRVSSPWPDRIDVREARRLDADRVEVRGEVVYVSSMERARGGSASREPVTLRVDRMDDGSWRIGAYERDGSA